MAETSSLNYGQSTGFDISSPSQLVAADIGAGTGISSRLLAEREVKVVTTLPLNAKRYNGSFQSHD